MATLAFDSLRYARRLREAGMPEPQADVQAELMAEAFGFYADNILTKDHFEAVLDARFAQQDAKFDKRFVEQDVKVEKRLAEQDAKLEKRLADQYEKIDQRFAGQDEKFEKRFTELNTKFDEQNARFEPRFARLERMGFLHTWMLGLVFLVSIVPELQAWLG